MAVSKRLRFEVLRRDGFACRYCGGKAPAIELVVDHVVPRTLGGSDHPSNLTAACVECNTGKSSCAPDFDLVGTVAAAEAEWQSSHRPYREAVALLFGALPDFDREGARQSLAATFDAAHADDEDEDGRPRVYAWPVELKAFYVAVQQLADRALAQVVRT